MSERVRRSLAVGYILVHTDDPSDNGGSRRW